MKENSPMEDICSTTTTPIDASHTTVDGEPVKPMEDDSHSGNCSYDADASNDSIELNLSLDEQQHYQQVNHHKELNLFIRLLIARHGFFFYSTGSRANAFRSIDRITNGCTN